MNLLNRIILIGNGFDLAHGLKTSYRDFIAAFWREELKKTNQYKYLKPLSEGRKSCYLFEDDFIKVKLENLVVNIDDLDNEEKSYGKCAGKTKDEIQKKENELDNTIASFKRKISEYKNGFLEDIEQAIHLNNWVDIEELYYKKLVRCAKQELDSPNDVGLSSPVKKLNKDFEAISFELEKYLSSLDKPEKKDTIAKHLERDKPEKVLFLSFNYTNTESLYATQDEKGVAKEKVIHIHGELNNPKNKMIFGYGDELAKNFTEMENLNNNCFFENTKSVKYAETNNYSELEEFLQEGDYEIFIFGHSCGNSDRTLLNLLFEKGIEKGFRSGKCRSIKIFYHQREDGTDDYSEKTQNIFRNFEIKANYRNLVKDKDKNHTALIPLDELPDPVMDNMITVEFDKSAEAYEKMDNEITSKKDLQTGFQISKFLVTLELYTGIMKKNPSYFGVYHNLQCPVDRISWYDAVEFCNKLSELKGLTPYYKIDKKNNPTDQSDNLADLSDQSWIVEIPDKSANGFRLPTEAEWEYAAKGGVKGKGNPYAGCNTEEELKYYAWYELNSENKTHPVGEWKPNELGLYDMSGNVWEWCEDKVWYNEGWNRVVRGGSWLYSTKQCQVSRRDRNLPNARYRDFGFRLTRSI